MNLQLKNYDNIDLGDAQIQKLASLWIKFSTNSLEDNKKEIKALSDRIWILEEITSFINPPFLELSRFDQQEILQAIQSWFFTFDNILIDKEYNNVKVTYWWNSTWVKINKNKFPSWEIPDSLRDLLKCSEVNSENLNLISNAILQISSTKIQDSIAESNNEITPISSRISILIDIEQSIDKYNRLSKDEKIQLIDYILDWSVDSDWDLRNSDGSYFGTDQFSYIGVDLSRYPFFEWDIPANTKEEVRSIFKDKENWKDISLPIDTRVESEINDLLSGFWVDEITAFFFIKNKSRSKMLERITSQLIASVSSPIDRYSNTINRLFSIENSDDEQEMLLLLLNALINAQYYDLQKNLISGLIEGNPIDFYDSDFEDLLKAIPNKSKELKALNRSFSKDLWRLQKQLSLFNNLFEIQACFWREEPKTLIKQIDVLQHRNPDVDSAIFLLLKQKLQSLSEDNDYSVLDNGIIPKYSSETLLKMSDILDQWKASKQMNFNEKPAWLSGKSNWTPDLIQVDQQADFTGISNGSNSLPKEIRSTLEESFGGNTSEGVNAILQSENNKSIESSPQSAEEYLKSNFWKTIFLLFQSLRWNLDSREALRKHIVAKDSDGKQIGLYYRQLISEIEKQRELNPLERAYLESVESLTRFNAYMVSVLSEAPWESSEFLSFHMNQLSSKTWTDIEDYSYVPQIHIGTGPDWLAYLWEQARTDPELAKDTLIIDSGMQPWWPFAVPEWAAWSLNSSNWKSKSPYVLPDAWKWDLSTIRDWWSPFRWYPWERNESNTEHNIRPGSINVAADYSITPDMISNYRYPTNEELQMVLSAQTALIAEKICLNTTVTSVEPVDWEEWKKLVSLVRVYNDWTRETKFVYTDSVVNSSWLWETNYWFNVGNGSRAKRVLEQMDEKSFPQISDTLTAFKCLASRRNKVSELPSEIAISGTGDSTAVLLEYLAQLFHNENPAVKWVQKIYVISTDSQINQRPRYSQILDVLERGGRKNLVEFVTWRVWDVWDNWNTKSPLTILDDRDDILFNADGNRVNVWAFISAAGFKANTDKIYAAYKNREDNTLSRESLSLPTNSQISVGEALAQDPNIIFVWTAANWRFNSEKKWQLPSLSDDALERVGPENVVAIWFNSQDAQAAARIYLGTREKYTSLSNEKTPPTKPYIRIYGQSWPLSIDLSKIEWHKGLDNIKDPNSMLTSFLHYKIRHSNIDPALTDFEQSLEVVYDNKMSNASISWKWKKWVSKELLTFLSKLILTPEFHSYAKQSMISRRGRKNSLSINIKLQGRKIMYDKTFIEAV